MQIEITPLAARPPVYFVDAAMARATVIYLRQDGHHGLVEPSRDGGR
jgi:hypothetical protein